MTDADGYARVRREVAAWHDDAACRPLSDRLDWIEAKPGTVEEYACRVVCSTCPVRYQCALGALERGEAWGVWGGLNRRDRIQVAAAFGFPRPGIPPEHGTDARYKRWDCRCPECRRGHAVYEVDRRARAHRAARRRGLTLDVAVYVCTRSVGRGARRVHAGQLALALGGVPLARYLEELVEQQAA